MARSNEIPKDFGHALAWLKVGRRISRSCWDGMYLWVNKGTVETFPEHSDLVEGVPDSLFVLGGKGTIPRLPHINQRSASGATLTGWLPTGADLLAEDWVVHPDEYAPAPQFAFDSEF